MRRTCHSAIATDVLSIIVIAAAPINTALPSALDALQWTTE
jgi:hypothetical protein